MICKVYKFGLLPPIKNADLVAEQMRGAHAFQNECIRIENDRREQIRLIGPGMSEQIRKLEDQVKEIDAQIETLIGRVGKKHSAQRNKETSPADKAQANALKSVRKSRYEALRELYKPVYKTEEYKAKQAAINESAKQAANALNTSSSVFWGTKGLKRAAVNTAAEMQPMYLNVHFQKWDGSGAIGVQIQTQSTEDFTRIDDVFSGKCSQIQIDPVDPAVYYATRGERRRLTRTKLRIRVKSDDKKKPVWAEFPMVLHRPIPTGTIITGATVSRRVYGPKVEWTCELSLRLEEKPCAVNGSSVAIDIGWRDAGSIRVATWANDNGETGMLEIPEQITSGLEKVDSIKSIRSTNFDEAIEYFRAWLKLGQASDWLKEQTATIHSWKSIGRLAAVVKRWAGNRFDGDEAIFDRLEKWRYNDYHLWAWEAGQRRSTLRQRKDFYRNFAAKLAAKHQLLVLEKFKLTKIAQRPELHENEDDNETARSNRQSAAVSEMRLCLKNAFGKSRVIEVDPKNTSKRCNSCGSIQAIGSALRHQCSECGTEYDRDENAAKNILELGLNGQTVETTVKPRRLPRKQKRERLSDAPASAGTRAA